MDDFSKYDNLGSKDIRDMINVLENLMKLGVHEHVFCSVHQLTV